MTTEELKDEIDDLKNGHASGEANILAAFAALKDRAEDAELIAWGLLRRKAPMFSVNSVGMDCPYYSEYETGAVMFLEIVDGKFICTGTFGTIRNPNFTLTPAAREALRQAKEQSK